MQFQTTGTRSFLKKIKYLSILVFLISSIQILQLTLASEVLQGIASWYGPNFAGKVTANGEVFNPRELTAAHQSLAFNTIVRVTNLRNGQSVDVRINDRGPFIDNRIIDLSEAAAEHIDMKYAGLAPVQLRIIQAGNPPLVIEPVDTSKYTATKYTTTVQTVNSNKYTSNYLGSSTISYTQDIQQISPSTLQNTTREYSPASPVLPLPFSLEETLADTSTTINDSTTYTALKSGGEEWPAEVSANTNGVNTLKVIKLAGLTLQEVIVPDYPIGTQFLLGSSTGKEVWVQVIGNQLPPQTSNAFLVSEALLSVLGSDLKFLQQQ